ncbi:MAG: hypothetical protein ABSH02_01890 [Candidatus Sulfotelmatobacter sp.]|jgi:hypothetical protein
MKRLLLIVTMAFTAATSVCVATQAAAQASAQVPASSAPTKDAAIPLDQKNANQARELLEQGIKALGGEAYLNAHDMQEQGRVYSFYHGRPTSNGVLFWRFVEFPDKERIELTQQRDIAYIYAGNKGYEVTYKGPRAVEKKDLDDYLRRRKFSLETILRTWVNDPTVALFYDGNALAGSLAAQRVTLINSKDESVSVYFDIDTHLPIKKSYTWRDPADNERNVEEETFDGYRLAQGIMTPFGFTRYFNGDMQSERFITVVTYIQSLNPAMFDPDSGYNPLKVPDKNKKDSHK